MHRKFDYSTASILIGALSIEWLFAPRPFDPYKHHDVGTMIAIVTICFAMARLRPERPPATRMGRVVDWLALVLRVRVDRARHSNTAG